MTSRQWSSESGCADHVDVQATAMGMDRVGKLAMLGGKKCWALVDLGGENTTLAVCHRQSIPSGQRWDVTRILWNPSHAHSDQVGVASANRLEVAQVTPTEIRHTNEVVQHTRLVTDLDWNWQNPQLVSTSSIDTFVQIWDVRDFRRPKMSLESVLPALQVQHHPQEEQYLISAHASDLKVWDCRHPSQPLAYVQAHSDRILCLHYSHSGKKVVTSGEDCLVNVFADLTQQHQLDARDIRPARQLKTAVPVFKARFVPFGLGLATVVLPNLQTNDNSLFLWSDRHFDFPVHAFYGHRDVILDFDWRSVQGSRDYQMLSWSRDQTLRLWQVTPPIQSKSGGGEGPEGPSYSTSSADEEGDKQEEEEETINEESEEDRKKPVVEEDEDEEESSTLTSSDAVLLLKKKEEIVDLMTATQMVVTREPKEGKDEFTSVSHTLRDEVSQIDATSWRHVRAEKLDWAKRTCKFTIGRDNQQPKSRRLRLTVSFPSGYPFSSGGPPTFALSRGSGAESSANIGSSRHRKRMLKCLKSTARERTTKGLLCLQDCLAKLELETRDIVAETDEADATSRVITAAAAAEATHPDPENILESGALLFNDTNVPYPRSSGARFSGNGTSLVCFARPGGQRALPRVSAQTTASLTPRTLAIYGAQVQSSMDQGVAGGGGGSGGFHYQHYGTVQRTTRQQQQQQQQLYPGDEYYNTVPGITSNNGSMDKDGGPNTNSLKKRGRFNVRRVTSNSQSALGVPAVAEDDAGVSKLETLTSSVNSIGPGPSRSSGGRYCCSQELVRKVFIYDVSALQPFDPKSAELFVAEPTNPEGSCLANAKVAASAGNHNRAKLWRLCAKLAGTLLLKSAPKPYCSDKDYPLGRPLLTAIFNHLMLERDLQMVTLLTCIFTPLLSRIGIAEKGDERLRQRIESEVTLKSILSRAVPPPPPPPLPPLPPPPPPRSLSRKKLNKVSSNASIDRKPKFWFLRPGALPAAEGSTSSPYHTIHASPAISGDVDHSSDTQYNNGSSRRHAAMAAAAITGAPFPTPSSESNMEQFVTPYVRATRSNSWSDPGLNEVAITVTAANSGAEQQSPAPSEEAKEDSRLENPPISLDSSQPWCYEDVRQAYASLLSIWGLDQQRCWVEKFCRPVGSSKQSVLPVTCVCSSCSKNGVRAAKCGGCRRMALRCTVCGRTVRGLSMGCTACGHAGHFRHWRDWFKGGSARCPSGCGCRCLEMM